MVRYTSVENLQRAIDRLDAADDSICIAFAHLSLADMSDGPDNTTVAQGLLAWRNYLQGLIADRSDTTDAGSGSDA